MPETIGIMKRLTAKEEEIMGYFWEKGPLFVKQLLEYYEEPKPHFNTLSTIVRGLEDKGFLSHNTFGNTYQYYAAVSETEYSKGTLKNVIAKYFNKLNKVKFILTNIQSYKILRLKLGEEAFHSPLLYLDKNNVWYNTKNENNIYPQVLFINNKKNN